jgi:ribokinase
MNLSHIDELKKLNPNSSIVVMHDFSIDRIIRTNSISEMYSHLIEKAKHGGGSIRNVSEVDIKGGNAVNVAYCLAKLGMKVHLFTIADEIGSAILKQIFSKFDNRVNLKISKGKHGLTTIIEFPNEHGRKVNVMLGYLGDIDKFGPEKIQSKEHKKILANADVVVITNWASNLKGTELIEYVFNNCKKGALRFIDPADIDTRKEEFFQLLKKLSSSIDVLSINENELDSIANCFHSNIKISKDNLNAKNIQMAAKIIAKEIQINVDLHTKIGSAWSNGDESFFSPSFQCKVKTITGAGDNWDSADIVGYLAGFHPKNRLLISNAYASLYIGNSIKEPSSMDVLCQFLKKNIVLE